MGSSILERKYTETRSLLDKMGYLDSFSIDSLPIVEILAKELSKAQANLFKLSKKAESIEIIAHELQENVEPYKDETIRLTRENSDLRLQLLRCEEKNSELITENRTKVHELQLHNSELKVLLLDFANRFKDLESELSTQNKNISVGLKQKILELSITSKFNLTKSGEQRDANVGSLNMSTCCAEITAFCPHCTRVRNYVEYGKWKDPSAIDYIKLSDSRIECLQLLVQKLKKENQGNDDKFKLLEAKILGREKEIENLRKSIGLLQPPKNRSDEAARKQHNLELALKAAQLQLSILQRRNIELEEKFKSSFFNEHAKFVKDKNKRKVAENEMIDELLSSYSYPNIDGKSSEEKIKLLEAQLSHCCEEKAKLRLLLQKSEKRSKSVGAHPSSAHSSPGKNKQNRARSTSSSPSSARTQENLPKKLQREQNKTVPKSTFSESQAEEGPSGIKNLRTKTFITTRNNKKNLEVSKNVKSSNSVRTTPSVRNVYRGENNKNKKIGERASSDFAPSQVTTPRSQKLGDKKKNIGETSKFNRRDEEKASTDGRKNIKEGSLKKSTDAKKVNDINVIKHARNINEESSELEEINRSLYSKTTQGQYDKEKSDKKDKDKSQGRKDEKSDYYDDREKNKNNKKDKDMSKGHKVDESDYYDDREKIKTNRNNETNNKSRKNDESDNDYERGRSKYKGHDEDKKKINEKTDREDAYYDEGAKSKFIKNEKDKNKSHKNADSEDDAYYDDDRAQNKNNRKEKDRNKSHDNADSEDDAYYDGGRAKSKNNRKEKDRNKSTKNTDSEDDAYYDGARAESKNSRKENNKSSKSAENSEYDDEEDRTKTIRKNEDKTKSSKNNDTTKGEDDAYDREPKSKITKNHRDKNSKSEENAYFDEGDRGKVSRKDEDKNKSHKNTENEYSEEDERSKASRKDYSKNKTKNTRNIPDDQLSEDQENEKEMTVFKKNKDLNTERGQSKSPQKKKTVLSSTKIPIVEDGTSEEDERIETFKKNERRSKVAKRRPTRGDVLKHYGPGEPLVGSIDATDTETDNKAGNSNSDGENSKRIEKRISMEKEKNKEETMTRRETILKTRSNDPLKPKSDNPKKMTFSDLGLKEDSIKKLNQLEPLKKLSARKESGSECDDLRKKLEEVMRERDELKVVLSSSDKDKFEKLHRSLTEITNERDGLKSKVMELSEAKNQADQKIKELTDESRKRRQSLGKNISYQIIGGPPSTVTAPGERRYLRDEFTELKINQQDRMIASRAVGVAMAPEYAGRLSLMPSESRMSIRDFESTMELGGARSDMQLRGAQSRTGFTSDDEYGTGDRSNRQKALESEVLSLKSAINKLDIDKDEMRRELDKKDEKIAKLEAQLKSNMGDLDKFQTKLKQSEAGIRKKDDIFRDQDEEIVTLRRQAASLKREVEQVTTERDELLRKLHRVSISDADKRNIQHELDRRNREVEDLKTKIQRYVDDVRKCELLLEAKEREYEAILEEYRALQGKLLKMESSSMDSDSGRYGRQTPDSSGLKSINRQGGGNQVNSYEAQIKDLSKEVVSLETQLRKSKELEKFHETGNKNFRSEVGKVEENNDKLRLELSNLTSANRKLEADNKDIRAQAAELENMLKSANDKLRSQDKMLATYGDNESTLKHKIQELKNEINELQSRNQFLEKKNETLLNEMSASKLKLTQATTDLERIQRQLETEKIERNAAVEELKNIRLHLTSPASASTTPRHFSEPRDDHSEPGSWRGGSAKKY